MMLDINLFSADETVDVGKQSGTLAPTAFVNFDERQFTGHVTSVPVSLPEE
jgi:hypothetical protein